MLFRLLVDATPDMAFLITREGLILAANRAVEQWFGKAPGTLEGTNILEFLDPESSARRSAWTEKVFETGEPVHFEDQRNGFWFDHRIFPLRNAEGKVSLAAVFTRNQTERKAGEALIELLHDLAAGLARTSRLSEALDLSLEAALGCTNADGGGIYIQDNRVRKLQLQCHRGLSPHFAASVSEYSPPSPQYALLAQGGAWFIDAQQPKTEAESQLSAKPRKEGFRALAFVPILSGGDFHAGINVGCRGRSEFLELEKRALKAVADEVGKSLHRIRLEEELRAGEAELRAINDATPVMMAVVDEDRQVVRSNRAFDLFVGETKPDSVGTKACGVLGCVNALENSQGCGFGRACAACTIRLSLLDSLRNGNAHRDIEKTFEILRQGKPETAVFLASTSRIESPDGPQALLCLQDITAIKLAEEAVRKSESRYRTLVEASPGAVFAIRDGHFVYTNPAAEVSLGYGTGEMVGLPTGERLHPDSRSVVEDLVRSAREGIPPSRGEIKAFRKDGSVRFFESALVSVELDGMPTFLVLGQDITARKQSEEIFQARLQLSEAADALDLDALLQKTLDEAERLTGSKIGFFHFLEEDQATLSLQAWSTQTLSRWCTAEGKGRHYDVSEAGVWVDCVRERRAVIHNDYPSLGNRSGLPEGHAPIIRELVIPIFRDDRIVAILGVGNKDNDYDEQDVEAASLLANIAWDVVQRKRAETELKASHQTLRQLNRRLGEVAEQEKKRLTETLHDDLGPLLTALGLNLNFIRNQVNESGPQQMIERLDQSIRLVEDAAEKTRSIMTAMHPAILSDYGLASTLRWWGDQFSATAGIDVEVWVDDELPAIANALQIVLYRIAQEALNNVAKHSYASSVTIALEGVGDAVHLRISDNGVGFENEADSPSPGTPHWGLLTMKERAVGVGGRFRVVSSPGKGTSVEVEVPV